MFPVGCYVVVLFCFDCCVDSWCFVGFDLVVLRFGLRCCRLAFVGLIAGLYSKPGLRLSSGGLGWLVVPDFDCACRLGGYVNLVIFVGVSILVNCFGLGGDLFWGVCCLVLGLL